MIVPSMKLYDVMTLIIAGIQVMEYEPILILMLIKCVKLLIFIALLCTQHKLVCINLESDG